LKAMEETSGYAVIQDLSASRSNILSWISPEPLKFLPAKRTCA
jgi:hypothetical protein